MKKIKILGIALIALFAFGAIAASSALAEGLLLWEAKEITEMLEIQVTSGPNELLLEDMGATGKPDILCAGIFDILVEPGGATGFINDALMSNGELLRPDGTVGTPGDGFQDMVECVDHTSIKVCSGEVLVTTVGLPWSITIELMGTAPMTYLAVIKATGTEGPGYAVECKTFIGTFTDKCTGATSAVLSEPAGSLEGEFSETESEPAECTESLGKKEGLLFGVGAITDVSGGKLSVSE